MREKLQMEPAGYVIDNDQAKVTLFVPRKPVVAGSKSTPDKRAKSSRALERNRPSCGDRFHCYLGTPHDSTHIINRVSLGVGGHKKIEPPESTNDVAWSAGNRGM